MDIKTIGLVDTEIINSINETDKMLIETDGDMIKVSDFYIDRSPYIWNISDVDFDYNGCKDTEIYNNILKTLDNGATVYFYDNEYDYIYSILEYFSLHNGWIALFFRNYVFNVEPSDGYDPEDLYVPKNIQFSEELEFN